MTNVEKGLNVISETITALRASPLLLALILLQLMTVASVLYGSIHRQNAVTAQIIQMNDIIKDCIRGRNSP